MIKRALSLFLLLTVLVLADAQQYYSEDNGWIVGENLQRYNNRPIYLHNTNAFILTGDKPLFRFVKWHNLYGTLFFTYIRKGDEKPLCGFDNIRSMYKGGQMKWILTDKAFPSLVITMEVVPVPDSFGGIIKISAAGASSDDMLKWNCGGHKDYKKNLSWAFDVMGHSDILGWGVSNDFNSETEGTKSCKKDILVKAVMNKQLGLDISVADNNEFDNAYTVLATFHKRLEINTPDKYLNAVAHASLTAVDGSWYPPVFVHGCLQWNRRFPGWRTLFGGTMYGWHDRIFDEAKFYIDSQVKTSDYTKAEADSSLMLTTQSKHSRYYGVGRIKLDQEFYDMQTQFFDQLIEEYRWNNSPLYVRMLRPALELHLQWMDECFDPDGDGLYESYINTWPTDSQWYNGSGTAEETSYAYRAHKAAMDMAVAEGDSVAAGRHRKIMSRIKSGFFSKLWLSGSGHSGAYREQGGYERVHTNPWLYSIFLPIDARLTTELQNIESLYYTEYALQNDTIPDAGRMVWTSNWVPGVWSVRELWPGDNYHLAQMYFHTGLSDDGWQIMKGTFMNTGFRHLVPGNIGSRQGGIDFGDCIHTFARVLAEGLFGYNPDYPDGKVTFAPSFPSYWKNASIALPDFRLAFSDSCSIIRYDFELSKAAAMDIHIPVRTGKIISVTLNGKDVHFDCESKVGCTSVTLSTDTMKRASVAVRYADTLSCKAIRHLSLTANTEDTISFDGFKVLDVYDPQHVFRLSTAKGGIVVCKVGDNRGFHTVVAKLKVGDYEQLSVLRINVRDKEKEQIEKKETVDAEEIARLKWHPVDISKSFNADVRDIYRQKYLSPRPNTVSVRIGYDGYSPWTFTYWKSKAPEIKLDSVSRYMDKGNLITPQGVKFRWSAADKNIAFVSLWDNYPNDMSFKINRGGKVISLLVCGSTNMMQCGISNADICLDYDNGERDTVSLVPPVNYWNLSPIEAHPDAPGQNSRSYYDTSDIDKFCMPEVMPLRIRLGKNCTAMIITHRLKDNAKVKSVTMKCRSQEVVVGVMGISVGQ